MLAVRAANAVFAAGLERSLRRTPGEGSPDWLEEGSTEALKALRDA